MTGSDIEVVFEPDGIRCKIPRKTSILDASRMAGVSVRSLCGGLGLCGKCKVIVKDRDAVSKVTSAETKYLSQHEVDAGYRLACHTLVKKDVTIVVSRESRTYARKIQVTGLERPVPLDPLVKKFKVILPRPTLLDSRADLERLIGCLRDKGLVEELEADHELLRVLPDILRDSDWSVTVTVWKNRKIIAVEPKDTSAELFGLAVDIGTSKIVVYLVNLTTGKTVEAGSTENPQLMYGEDIISRIAFADKGKVRVLQKLAIEGINDVLKEIYKRAKIDPDDVYGATVVGNTAMHHFFLGIQPKYLSFSPFPPALKSSIDIKAKDLNIKINPRGVTHVLPVIAGFVGADAVGDVLSSGIHESEELSLLMDIGTNTELFLGNKGDILCCSCASGPAFEGLHIKHGMKAVTGAIEKVCITPSYEVLFKTIGDVRPIGLCGSAIIDVIAEMFKRKIVDRRGRFNFDIEMPRLRVADDGPEFVLVYGDKTGTGKEITITQKDVSEIQLAKAAIFTGCSILMKSKEVEEGDVDRVLIAGAFGSNLNPESARLIGLIPNVPTDKINIVGNTAITGAKMALISNEAWKDADKLSKNIRYLELATHPDFTHELISAMFIPHRDR